MTQQDESNQMELNNNNGHIDQTSDPIEKFASGQTAFPNTPIATKYIATGNGDITQSNSGEVKFEPDNNINSKPITLQDLLNAHVPSDKHHEFLTMLSDKLNGSQPNDIGNQDELTS